MSIPYDFNPLGSNFSSSDISGMYLDGTALRGMLCNPNLATTVGEGADGSMLTDSRYMFSDCYSLTSWNVDLPNLTNAVYMFYNCSNLSSFSGDLPKLRTGGDMFNNCINLTSWTVDLPKLENGY